jgi:hypothetical protein
LSLGVGPRQWFGWIEIIVNVQAFPDGIGRLTLVHGCVLCCSQGRPNFLKGQHEMPNVTHVISHVVTVPSSSIQRNR